MQLYSVPHKRCRGALRLQSDISDCSQCNQVQYFRRFPLQELSWCSDFKNLLHICFRAVFFGETRVDTSEELLKMCMRVGLEAHGQNLEKTPLIGSTWRGLWAPSFSMFSSITIKSLKFVFNFWVNICLNYMVKSHSIIKYSHSNIKSWSKLSDSTP